jgi:hypothetical protein
MGGVFVPVTAFATRAGVVAQRRRGRTSGEVVRHTDGSPDLHPVSIANALAATPLTIGGRVTRVTILPKGGWLLATLTDGSADATLAFRREAAPHVPTGAHLVAVGMFSRTHASPRLFDAAVVTLVDAELQTRLVFGRDAA